jgi:ribosomal protein S12 methylthiotransferase accessory factor YcaO
MPARDEVVRDYVLQESQEEIRGLALDGLSPNEIDEWINGRRMLTGEEREVVYLLVYHAVAEARGNY